MTPVRVAASVGVVLVLLVILASVWALGAVVAPRPPMDLGPPIVVPTAGASTTVSPSAKLTPTQTPTATVTLTVSPTANSTPATTVAPTISRATEAVEVPKPPVPRAGDDDDDLVDDDDDPFDDDTDDDDDDEAGDDD